MNKHELYTLSTKMREALPVFWYHLSTDELIDRICKTIDVSKDLLLKYFIHYEQNLCMKTFTYRFINRLCEISYLSLQGDDENYKWIQKTIALLKLLQKQNDITHLTKFAQGMGEAFKEMKDA